LHNCGDTQIGESGPREVRIVFAKSFMFEFICIPILAIGMGMLWKQKNDLLQMKEEKRNIFAVKNFEEDPFEDED
jgi:hypothetical protein